MRALLAATLALTFAAATPAASAFCRTTTVAPEEVGSCPSEGIPLQWQSVCVGFSLNVQGSPELPFDAVSAQTAAAGARWHDTTCDPNSATQPYFQLLPLGNTTLHTGYNPAGPNANSVWFNSVWPADRLHRPMAIAITVVTFDRTTGQILDADIELNQRSNDNPSGFTFSIDNGTTDTADLPTILTHEFGHFQGLAHTDVSDAVMYPMAGLGEQRRELHSDDIVGLCSIYLPDNAPNRSCNPVPFGGLAWTASGTRVVSGCAVRSGRAALPGGQGRGLEFTSLALLLAWRLRYRRRT